MSTTITADGTQPLALTTTGPSNGPTAVANDVNVPVQAIINGTVRLGTFSLADTTALAAYVGQQPNERIFVVGYGPYRYNQSGPNSTTLPFLVAASGGTGQWQHALVGLAGVAPGFATLAGANRLAQLPLNAIVEQEDIASSNATFSTNSTSYIEITAGTGTTVTLLLAEAGDIIDVDIDATISVPGNLCSLQMVVTENGGGDITSATWVRTSGTSQVLSISLRHTVTTTGVCTIRVQVKSSNAGSTQSGVVQSVRATMVRP